MDKKSLSIIIMIFIQCALNLLLKSNNRRAEKIYKIIQSANKNVMTNTPNKLYNIFYVVTVKGPVKLVSIIIPVSVWLKWGKNINEYFLIDSFFRGLFKIPLCLVIKIHRIKYLPKKNINLSKSYIFSQINVMFSQIHSVVKLNSVPNILFYSFLLNCLKITI